MNSRKMASVERRAALMQELTSAASDAWIRSDNQIKRRIARVEVAWREGLSWLIQDVHTMFGNFTTVSDAFDELDVNLAAVKSLLVDKGVFTDEEYAARRKSLFGMLDRERERRQAEIARIQAEEAARAEEARSNPGVDAELVEMHRKARETTDLDHVPRGARVF